MFAVLQHSHYRLSNVPKSLSLWSFLTVEALRPLPYTGKIQPRFESQFLRDSRQVFHPAGPMRKNQPHSLFPIFPLSGATNSYDAAQLTLTDSHRLTEARSIIIHAPFPGFRFSGYGFTTLCTTHFYRNASHSGVSARVLPAVLTYRSRP